MTVLLKIAQAEHASVGDLHDAAAISGIVCAATGTKTEDRCPAKHIHHAWNLASRVFAGAYLLLLQSLEDDVEMYTLQASWNDLRESRNSKATYSGLAKAYLMWKTASKKDDIRLPLLLNTFWTLQNKKMRHVLGQPQLNDGH